jgi:DNA polymerase-3 subunit delta'
VVGHDATLRFLEQALAQERLAHAYLLVGPPRVGKRTLALALARAVNCEGDAPPCGECTQCRRIAAGRHADVVVLEVEESGGHKAISIDAIRDLQHQVFLKPYEGRCRVYIIQNAELLTEAAANALLKTLEEPPPQLLLLLTSAAPGQLPATVPSRCQRLELRPLPEPTVAQALESRWSQPSQEARRLARLSRGCIGWAIQAVEEPGVLESRSRHLQRLDGLALASLEERFSYAAELASLMPQQRSALMEVMELWTTWWRDLLTIQAGAPDLAMAQEEGEAAVQAVWELSPEQLVQAVKGLRRTQELLEMNVNPRLALENLMLALPTVAPARATKA